MKLQKYVFMWDGAIAKVCRRMRIPLLNASDIFTLYAVHYLPLHCSRQGIHRHAVRMKHPISINSIGESATRLKAAWLLQEEAGRLSITSEGRSFIAQVRMYLLNKRLS